MSHKQVVALTNQRYDFFLDRLGDNPPSAASTQNELEMHMGVDQDITSLEDRFERWSRIFGPVVKVDRMTKEVIPNDKTKEPFARFQSQGCA